MQAKPLGLQKQSWRFKFMATPEKVLETRLLEWLNSLEDSFFFKINTLGVYDTKRKVFRKNNNKHIHQGTADIIGSYKGTFVAIEVKAGYNKPSTAQKSFLSKCQKSGAFAFWTNDFEECKQTFFERFGCVKVKDYALFDELF